MLVKTGIRAGDGAAGGGALTAENASEIFAKGLEAAGMPQIKETLSSMVERQQKFEQRLNSPSQLQAADWWVHDDLIANGIPAVVRSRVKDRVRASFAEHRGEDEVFPCQNAARSMRCLMLAKVSERKPQVAGVSAALSAVQFAKLLHGESHPVTKQLGLLAENAVDDDILKSDSPARIGLTIPDAFLPGFVSFLRPRSVFLAASPMEVRMERGKVSFWVQTGGTTFQYVASETSVPERTSLDFAERAFVARYLKGLVVWSIQALRRTGIVTDALILNDMLAGGADAVDAAALLGDGTDAEPKGLLSLIHADHVVPASVLTTGQDNSQQIRAVTFDLRARLDAVVAVANITPQRMVLFTSFREFLFFLEHRTNDGAPAWPSVAANGTLSGMPLFWTGRIPTDGATPANIGSTIIGQDMSQAVFAEEEGMEIDISFEASITDGSGTFNLWERRSAAAQLIAIHDIGLLRDKAGFVLTEVNYGGIGA